MVPGRLAGAKFCVLSGEVLSGVVQSVAEVAVVGSGMRAGGADGRMIWNSVRTSSVVGAISVTRLGSAELFLTEGCFLRQARCMLCAPSSCLRSARSCFPARNARALSIALAALSSSASEAYTSRFESTPAAYSQHISSCSSMTLSKITTAPRWTSSSQTGASSNVRFCRAAAACVIAATRPSCSSSSCPPSVPVACALFRSTPSSPTTAPA
mmetsp:Transcript_9967/g.25052  ORF Transcript_9967/g.25052 Transcript_9967/m.25052 type:complete len:212 (-) Transcript_9967:989-1624(-)